MIHRLLRICAILAVGVLALAFSLGGIVGSLWWRLMGSAPAPGRPTTGQTSPGAAEGGTSQVPRVKKRRALLALAGLAVVTALGAFLVVASGIIPIEASSRHWPITEWFLHFAMRRSIATHSLGIQTPSLDDPDLVLKGGTHYEIGCRPCHGSPGMPQPRIPHQMTPHPPELASKVQELKPRELFHVVKHGVKFTGMPAWPALQRDDEVWAVVAFLKTLPHLDEAGYRRLVQGESAATAPIHTLGGAPLIPSAIARSCARCHGSDGIGMGSGAFPKLAGQRQGYLENALESYARAERHSGIMEPISAGLGAEAMREVVRYYADLAPPEPPPPHAKNAAAIERGRAIARHGIPDQRVASCIDCHAPEGGQYKAHYPALGGQHADYLVLQLELFKKGHRGGSAFAHLMEPIAKRLKPDQMRDVALYFESVGTPRPSEAQNPAIAP